MKIKTGQNVKVTTGKDKGKTGKVIQVFPALQKVVVEGVNKMYKHIPKRKESDKGERIEFSGPIHVSNVKIVVEEQKEKKVKIEKTEKKEKKEEKDSGKEKKNENKEDKKDS